MTFPIDLSQYRPVVLDPSRPELSADEAATLRANIELARDAIVLFTAVAGARGLGGHTGGAYDIVPELLIADGLMRGSDSLVPICWDEAGHRVAAQYLLSVLRGHMAPARLLQYREAGGGLPGHPERDFTPGVDFSSGRLGHMWPFANGVARAHPDKKVVLFGSDGSQQEGNSAEAARLAVAHKLEVKLLIDVNDVTIAGFPSDYMQGFDVGATLGGAGLTVMHQDGEDVEELYRQIHRAINTEGPVAVTIHRKMAPGVPDIEGETHGHDVIARASAEKYFANRQRPDLVEFLQGIGKESHSAVFLGSNDAKGKNRDRFGAIVCDLLDEMEPQERVRRVVAIDSDLEGSCGLHHIRKRHPEVYILGGVQERGNFSAAAGFGSTGDDRQGIFGTFSAFSEMVISELTMARLNHANVLAHFSHAGVDDMADNTCHFGINLFFLDGGLAEHDDTQLYFPADQHQFEKVLRRIFHDPGARIIGSTRSTVPDILDEDGNLLFGDGYEFEPGRDDVVREGSAGYVVSYGEMLYRALDAVEKLRADGLDVGLINKSHLNAEDDQTLERIGRTGFVLVAETQNRKTGLGSRLGSQLLRRGLRPAYDHLGVTKEGLGGLWQQIPHQGLDPDSIVAKVREMAG